LGWADRTLRALLVALLAATAGCGSEPEIDESKLPLRPLLYTESQGEGLPRPDQLEEWTRAGIDPVAWQSGATEVEAPGEFAPATSPQALLSATYRALIAGKNDPIDALTFEPATFGAITGSGVSAARDKTAALRATLQELASGTFGTPRASFAREGGLGAQLVTTTVTLGSPHLLDGSVPSEDQKPEMLWNSSLQLRWSGTQVSFTLHFPKIARDKNSDWRLLAAPTVDANFLAFRAAGLDLNPALMGREHASFPLSVGNFWHYRVTTPGRKPPTGAQGLELPLEDFRDEVEEIDDYGSYRVVRLLRTPDNPAESTSRFAWLVTPLQVYRCDRECQTRAEDARWLLAWMRRESPDLVLPAALDARWGPGGREAETSVVHISRDAVPMSLPAGNYPESFELIRALAAGKQSLYFVPSVGIIARRLVGRGETRLEELTSIRIMP